MFWRDGPHTKEMIAVCFYQKGRKGVLESVGPRHALSLCAFIQSTLGPCRTRLSPFLEVPKELIL